MSNPSSCSILDMPDEILVKIILHFDARKRLALANSCQRFNDLVFGDEELLRNLDFTGEQQLTEKSDIQQYFNDENTYKKILEISIEYVWPVSGISSLIGKAINLVELNILGGLEFESVEELSSFLKPLVHLKRFSVNWPSSSMLTNYDNRNWNQLLEEPLSRITYLFLNIDCYPNEFILILQLCLQLEELRMLISRDTLYKSQPLRQESMKLRNLKLIRLIGSADLKAIWEHIMCIIPDPAEWIHFHPVNPIDRIHIEVCAELNHVKGMPLPEYVENYRKTGSIDNGWPLVYEHLLNEVIRMTHEDAPEKFCCLSFFGYPGSNPCLLAIDETKKLLKDPRYQISYLNFSHLLEKNCDTHLFASAFPNLIQLVLSGICNRNLPEKIQPLHKRLRKRGSLASKEEHSDATNTDSSFKMLVENTPRLEVLEISPKHWERDGEYSGWKNLTVIHLCNIPITDGEFLIEIGKECVKLEEVELRNLGPNENCSYEIELLRMLQHCKNLRKLVIVDLSSYYMTEMLAILTHCQRLEVLDLDITIVDCFLLELASAVDAVLRQCLQLERLSLRLHNFEFCHALRCRAERVIRDLNSSDLEFYVGGSL